MTKLNWRKFPDEVPKSSAAIIIRKRYDGDELFYEHAFYDTAKKQFYRQTHNHYRGWFDEYLNENEVAKITHWIYADELPLPEE
ncbi:MULTISPECIES: hypothetical protein [unclassified Gilliamella]|uniref:hypothetical protein n=1 Tax=unclassified Gilliamella TaxID=2685620 RepID=UPI00132C0E5F|nr:MULTISPECIES: hypothetical protein [unclassified Gilliamella]MWN30971.1 hypothetical protein [Gilliamella sp. Pra-s60]MWP28464.1 hypothetical protein [Gilliamella sp. Pra-s54]